MSKKQNKGHKHSIEFKATLSDILMLRLIQAESKIKDASFLTPEEAIISQDRVNKLIGIISKKIITDIAIDKKTGQIKIISPLNEEDLAPYNLQSLFDDKLINYILKYLLEELEETIQSKTLIKQSRAQQKSIAQTIHYVKEKPTLFTLPTEDIIATEERLAMSGKAGALAFYLIELYQLRDDKNKEEIVITNITPIAEKFNTNNFTIKVLLHALGGYAYPFQDKAENGGMRLSSQLLFDISFEYSPDLNNKWDSLVKYGNAHSHFILNETAERIIVKPNTRILNGLKGLGLGNVLTVRDAYTDLLIRLSDIGKKLLLYSSSNEPNWKINENSLIRDLGLNEQLKQQGRPRIRQSILNGLEELKQEGHFIKYSFKELTGLYEWSYSNKYVNFKKSKKAKEIEAKKERKVEE